MGRPRVYRCLDCGEVMHFTGKDKQTLMCGNCGEIFDRDYLDAVREYNNIYTPKGTDIPEGCAACGGPYPDCIISCSLFDD